MTNEFSVESASSSATTATLTMTFTLKAIVARRIRELRIGQRLKQKDLADRMTDLGVKMDAPRIARVERGASGLDLEQLAAVALALEVSLLDLITPADPADRVQITPTIAASRSEFRTWLEGSFGALIARARVLARNIDNALDILEWTWAELAEVERRVDTLDREAAESGEPELLRDKRASAMKRRQALRLRVDMLHRDRATFEHQLSELRDLQGNPLLPSHIREAIRQASSEGAPERPTP